jgi:two-component system OmpR family response regulator
MSLPRVLLVDDERDMLECLELALGEEFDTTSAANGKEALALLKAKPFDAVVLDLMMPEMDGLTVLSTLRADGLEVPVLVASAMPDLEATARAFGASGWISKPYTLDALAQRIRGLVRSRSAGRSGREARSTLTGA